VAVAPARPGFWLQHASNEARQLVVFADELAQTPPGRPGVAFAPVNAPRTLNELFERTRRAGDAILDPHGHALDLPPTKRAQQHFPWLAENPRPATQPQWEQWMQRALDHEQSAELRGAGPPPSFVMTPSPVIEAARGTLELYPVLDAAVAVASRQPAGTDCWLCVSVDRTYLREQPHLTRLANAMLATGATGFVFRCSHSQLPPVDDLRYLNGLREVTQACMANNIRIYLPNSGWLGWLAMAWGAWGFSGGMAAGTWVDRVRTPMTRPELPTLPYFEPQLLRSLPWRVHEQLVKEANYMPCTCLDCIQMGTNHDLTLAKRHQLRHAHNEGSALVAMPAAQRRASVANRLDAAIAFRDSLSTPTQGRVGAEFLDRWRALV
jgi:hypothetical protein